MANGTDASEAGFFGQIAKLVQIGAAVPVGDYRGPGARQYDLVQQYTGDVPFYVETALRTGGGPVLELGCGTGRVLIPLARAGLDVTGLDLSADMLAECRRKLNAEPQAVRDRVRLVEGDMRGFSLPGGASFGLALIPLYTFVHMRTQADKLACLRSAAAHLVPGGALLMDVELDAGYSETPAPVLDVARRDRETGELLLVLHQSRREPDGTILLNLLNITVGPDGRAALHAAASRESRTTPDELAGLLAASGLAVAAMWGDYSATPLAPGARSAVVWATKPQEMAGAGTSSGPPTV